MMKQILAGAVLATAASVSMAAAAPAAMMGNQMMNPWYVGVGMTYNANFNGKTNDDGVVASKQQSNNPGGEIFAGYQVNQYFGAEAGVAMFGQQQYKGSYFTDDVTTKETYKNAWNAHVVGTGTLNLTNWFAVYGDAGLGYMTAKLSNKEGDSIQNSGFGLVYGAGLQFNFNQFGIRTAYTVQAPANTSGDSWNAQDYVTLDVLYRFQG